jgi:hypothetical protein
MISLVLLSDVHPTKEVQSNPSYLTIKGNQVDAKVPVQTALSPEDLSTIATPEQASIYLIGESVLSPTKSVITRHPEPNLTDAQYCQAERSYTLAFSVESKSKLL